MIPFAKERRCTRSWGRGRQAARGDKPVQDFTKMVGSFGNSDDIYISWLVVWFPFFIFPYIGNNHPNWRSYFSEGFKPPTSIIHRFIYGNSTFMRCDDGKSRFLSSVPSIIQLWMCRKWRPWRKQFLKKHIEVGRELCFKGFFDIIVHSLWMPVPS